MTERSTAGSDSAARTAAPAGDAPPSLADSAPRLLRALEAAEIDAFEWDLGRDRVCAAGALSRELGLPAVASVAECLDRVHPEDRERLSLILSRLTPAAPQYTAAYRVRDGSGGYLQVADTGRAEFDDAGRPLRLFGTRRRLTDVDRVEQALREGEMRYRALLQAVPSMTFEGDPAGANTFASEQWCTYTGMTPEETAGLGWAKAVHPDDLRETVERWEQAMREGTACEMRHRIRAADGSYRWFMLRSLPQRDARGRIERWVGSLTDIEDLLRTEQALRESERRYRELVQDANSAIIRWRTDGTLTFFNEYAEKFFGYRPDEVLGKHVGMLVPAQDSAGTDLTHLAEDIVRNPDRYRSNVNENVCRDGRRVWMSWTNHPVLDERGAVREVLAVGSDITERIRIEQVLRYQLHLNQSITDKATDSIFVTDAVGRVTFANPEARRAFGYGAEELAGRLLHEAIHHHYPDGRPYPMSECPLCRVYDSGEVVRDLEGVFFHRDGHQIIVTASNAALEFDGRRVGAALVLHDITERKQAERRLFDTNLRLAALMKALPVGVSFSNDPMCRRVTGNPMLLAQFEMTPGDNVSASAVESRAAGRRVRYFQDGRELRDVELPLQRAAAENRVIAPMLLEVRLPSGRTWFAEVSGAPLHDAQANVIGGLAVVVDVTRHTQSERALRESQADLNRAQAVGHIGSWRLDVRSNTLTWSAETHRMFGIPEGTPMNYESFLAAVHPDDRAYVDRKWQAALRGEPYDVEHRLLIDGRIKWMREKAELEFDEHGRVMGGFGTTQDITDVKLAEHAMRDLNERLNALLDERTRLAEQRAAHLRELASELTRAEQRERDRLYELLHDHVQPLLVATRLTLSGLGRDTPVDTWIRLAADARSHITEALDTARSLSAELNPPLVREQGLTPALEWLSRWAQSRHHLRVDVHADAAAEPDDAATRLLLFKATRELLMNVAKHAAVTEVNLSMERVPGDLVQITVADRGVGFDAVGFRAGVGAEERSGLRTIVRRLGMIGGRIEIESSPGAGTRVALLAPLFGAAATARGPATPPAAARRRRGKETRG